LPSINLIKASDGTGNASTATVQTVRNSGVTTIIVDTVNNIPATFMGSMGTPHTFVDPVTSEEITVISEATAVDFTGHVSGANLEIDSIAPGYVDNGSAVGDIIVIRPTTEWANNLADTLAASHDNDGTLKAGAVTNAKLSTTAGEPGGAWKAWTPTFTGLTVGAGGTLTCAYTQIGKTVHGRIFWKFGTGSAVSGDVAVTLPVTAKAYPSTANIAPIGVTAAFDGFGVIMGFVGMQTTTSAVLRPTATNGAFLGITTYSATVPSTWATNHELTATFTYEAA